MLLPCMNRGCMVSELLLCKLPPAVFKSRPGMVQYIQAPLRVASHSHSAGPLATARETKPPNHRLAELAKTRQIILFQSCSLRT